MTSDKKSERFFKVLHDRMKRAQQETKSTVAVNMSDLGSQPREDREPADPTTKGEHQADVVWGTQDETLGARGLTDRERLPVAAALSSLAPQAVWHPSPCLVPPAIHWASACTGGTRWVSACRATRWARPCSSCGLSCASCSCCVRTTTATSR